MRKYRYFGEEALDNLVAVARAKRSANRTVSLPCGRYFIQKEGRILFGPKKQKENTDA